MSMLADQTAVGHEQSCVCVHLMAACGVHLIAARSARLMAACVARLMVASLGELATWGGPAGRHSELWLVGEAAGHGMSMGTAMRSPHPCPVLLETVPTR